ncbi:MAG TPA: SDR family NAD(P)-dependent oxidoreductase, partial [Thermoleophilaceae bacterium]
IDAPTSDGSSASLAGSVHDLTARTLALLQSWLAAEPLAESRLVLLTDNALATSGVESPNLAQAALLGLVRSAHSENPGRFGVIDLDGADASASALAGALAAEEPELALREGRALAPRLARASGLIPPTAGAWRLGIERTGSLEDLTLVPSDAADAPLAEGHVRVAMRAGGLNFRDVLIALGMYPGEAPLGSEGAGVVVETAADVEHLQPGDRVMGIVREPFGPYGVTDHHMLVPIPDAWSFAEAASVPSVFATAYYALVDLAGLKQGERILIHAAAGGVGMAAVQIAKHLGAEVYATASPAKWDTVRGLGVPDDHIASSRDLDFRDRFLDATEGAGMDVVLDALAREFVDASLDLLPQGGRFVEIGKADIREPDEVAAQHPGVRYRAFDLAEAGPDRIQAMLLEVVALFERDALHHLPVSAWDLRHAVDAFRYMREAKHVGKIVLNVPQPPEPDGTVLITGGTGGLGALVARHLAAEHGARRLLLTSRRGLEAEGARDLVAALAELGCEAQVAACDVADRAQLADLLAAIPAEHPLTAVVHAAGVLDDGVIDSLDGERLRQVMAPKVDGALNLHELTEDARLSQFVLFSSVASILGTPGQGNYAAANSFLDGLAHHRRAEGLPATALAWGAWERVGGMVGGLSEADRMRGERLGITGLSDELGLTLLDTARGAAQPLLVPVALDSGALRAQAKAGLLPPVLQGLVRTPVRRSSEATGSLATRLAAAPEAEWPAIVLDLVQSHVGAVLGHGSGDAIDPGRAFKELGFDSLSAVELRNRLIQATGLKLPTTLIFDHASPAAVAEFLRSKVAGADRPKPTARRAPASTDEPIAIVGMSARFPGGVHSSGDLWRLVESGSDAIGGLPDDRGWDLERLYDPDPDHPGTTYSREGGFLYDAGEFDADFFSISPREALAMDPQQRLLLEGAWEALEHAGIVPASLRGSQTGVFVGVSSANYGIGPGTPPDVEGFRLTGSTTSVASGRLAYTFGLEGPAVSVDTACSSSLVAMHWACQALRRGECEMALAGGVTVLATPGLFIEFSRQRGLSRDGRCKAFGAAADGTGWSEGAGILVLERLSYARRNGHRILAVIRGSAVNQD